jgi:hypothetical protein
VSTDESQFGFANSVFEALLVFDRPPTVPSARRGAGLNEGKRIIAADMVGELFRDRTQPLRRYLAGFPSVPNAVDALKAVACIAGSEIGDLQTVCE